MCDAFLGGGRFQISSGSGPPGCGVGKLRAIRGRISLAECESSSGAVREFYQCMTSSYNHVAACGDKHKYGE